MSLWDGRKVVVCVGTGGVGKTTIAAALAIAAAAQGKRTLVMTIDPARRLANAMGIAEIGNLEREIPSERLAAYGVQLKAPLFAMMPDVKRTFDELVQRTAPNPETRDRILNSRIYQYFSTSLVGSHEYAAVEKLYEVYASTRYDLIVLDTPPSQNAADFLEAPGKLTDFLDHETMQWLLKPYVLSGKLSLKLLEMGTSFFLKTLGKLAGSDTLREIAEFVLAFEGMYEGFRARSRRVQELLASEELAFVLVTSTAPAQHLAMLEFKEELRAKGFTVRQVLVNRVRAAPPGGEVAPLFAEFVDRTLAPLGGEVVAAVHQATREELALAQMEHHALAVLRRQLEGVPLLPLPELPTDVHDLAGLAELQRTLHNS